MISAVAEARIETRMDAIGCLDDVATKMLAIEARVVEVRRRTSECERHDAAIRAELATLRSEEADLHMQMHRLAHEVIADKKKLAQQNGIDAGRRNGK